MKTKQKMNVIFKDADNIRYDIDIEITHRNGYPEFSMSGQGSGSCGQCDSSIKPLGKNQKRLLEIWGKYHLNGMKSGTDKQEAKLKEMTGDYEYNRACKFLNSFDSEGKPIHAFALEEIEKERADIKKKISDLKSEIFIIEENEAESKTTFQAGGGWIIIKDLEIKEFCNTIYQKNSLFKKLKSVRQKKLDVLEKELESANEKTLLFDRLEDGSLHQYGHSWVKMKLPDNLWEEVLDLGKKIEKEEQDKKSKGGSWDDIDDYKIVALGKHLELEPKEAEEDIEESYDGVYSYCGTDYHVLTEDEAHKKAEDYLGDEMWQMAVQSGNTEMGKQEWIEYVIDVDGYGSILNGWDGTEDWDDDAEVYIMRT